MSGYTQSVTESFEFDGDTITISMARIKRADLIKVGPHLPKPGEEADQEKNLKVFEILAGIVGDYVKEFSGLKDNDGNSIAFDLVLDEAYFQDLLSEIIAWWFQASQMQQAEVGKRKGRRRAGSGV